MPHFDLSFISAFYYIYDFFEMQYIYWIFVKGMGIRRFQYQY
ncbi:hypothetical protein B4168_3398 [Anoxybacillus flavithermus]|nr:hypothetical protein B4168_3398 [Anoxybacillus flavithermus]OAO85030.1 hypothetical protein GT23_3084 [Parageobacillus thermoglucosidasius]